MNEGDMARAAAVAAANRLTARWADTWTGGGTVLSGIGVWPLLAALAEGAAREARDELAWAVGFPADEGLDAANGLLRVFAGSPALHYALGLWTAADLPVNDAWVARLAGAAHGVLDADPVRAQAALDAWGGEADRGAVAPHAGEARPGDPARAGQRADRAHPAGSSRSPVSR